MAPIVKARGSFTGDKTMMGDAHVAWESIVKDMDHGHFLLCVYDKIADKITVQKSGVSPETHSSHDVIAEEMQALAEQKTASWGAYSWKAVQNATPGQKEHSYHTACVLCIPKGCPDAELIQKIKNRVCQVVFQPSCDVYLEVNDATYVDDPEFWMRKRAVHPEGTIRADFGGGHFHEQEDCAHTQHVQEIEKRRRNSANVAEERKSEVVDTMEAERKRKVDLWQRATRLAEGMRKKNQYVAMKSMDQEQTRRIKEEGAVPSNTHEERFNKLKEELTGHEAEVKAAKASKKHVREQVHADALERQKELVAMWQEKDATMDALREQNANLCKRILGAEQQRRVSNHEEEYIRSAMAKEFSGSIRHELVEAHELMDRGVHQRGAKLAMDQEKRERCLDSSFASPQVQKQKADVQDELRKSVRKSAHVEM